MADRPVLIIALEAATAEPFVAQLILLRARHKAAKLILLSSPELAERLGGSTLVDEIWPEGHVRGIFRLLALLRRISWAGIGDVYDLQQNGFTRFVRLSVWPRPHWHRGFVSTVS